MLDHNPEFGLTKGLLPFVLRLLGYSAAPTLSDFPHMVVDDKQLRWTQCSYTLGSLPPNLQVPWLKVFFVILYKVRGNGSGDMITGQRISLVHVTYRSSHLFPSSSSPFTLFFPWQMLSFISSYSSPPSSFSPFPPPPPTHTHTRTVFPPLL